MCHRDSPPLRRATGDVLFVIGIGIGIGISIGVFFVIVVAAAVVHESERQTSPDVPREVRAALERRGATSPARESIAAAKMEETKKQNKNGLE